MSANRRAPQRKAFRRGVVQRATTALVASALLSLGGCSTSMRSLIPTIPPPPNFSKLWGGDSKKPGPLPEFKASVSPQIVWQTSVGKGVPGLNPAVTSDAIYAAAADGTIVRINPATGQSVWRISSGASLSAGVGADATLIAVGTSKGDVLAFDGSGKPLWQAKVTSEVSSRPVVADGLVVVSSGDGRVYALAAADGKVKWVYQRSNPPLMVRNAAGAAVSRGASSPEPRVESWLRSISRPAR